MVLDFIEIGTSDFETLIEGANQEYGLSIDAVDLYLNRLPNKPNVEKLNYAISDRSGEIEVFYVHPDDIEKYNLSWFLKGCNTIGSPHIVTLRELNERNLENLLQVKKVKLYCWKDLVEIHNIEQVKLLKIDVEGHDIKIVNNILDGGHDVYPETIIFEANELTSEVDRIATIKKAAENGYDFVEYNVKKDVVLKIRKQKKILLINSWFGPIPEYYKYHEKTLQFQNKNIDMYFFTDQNVETNGLSENYRVLKISEEDIIHRFNKKTGKNYEGSIVGKTSIMKLFFLNNFFDDIIDYFKYDYVGIYDTDTLFNNIYGWIFSFLGEYDYISTGGGVNHERLSGPFCIFKNTQNIMKIFDSEEYLQNVLIENVNFLEHELDQIAKKSESYKIIQYSQNVDHQTSKIIAEAEWIGGRVYCQGKEILLHHFFNKKDTELKFIGNSIISKYKKKYREDFYWVTYFTENYEKLTEGLIDSIKKYSNRKCILYTINYSSNLPYKLDEQFIVRRLDIPKGDLDSNGRDISVISSKPLILSDAIDFITQSKFIYIDTDVYLTCVADNLVNFFEEIENYPLMNSHVHDRLYANDITPSREWVSTIDILSDATKIPVRTFPRRKTNVILFDKNSKWFFEEQMEIYHQHKNTKPGIFRLHDEDSANILLSKYDFRKSLPLIDMEESPYLDMQKIKNYSYNISSISEHVKLPQNENQIYIFHGFKDFQFHKEISQNYGKTVLTQDDFILNYKNDTLFFQKNSFFTGKKIEDTVNFVVRNNQKKEILNLQNQKIFNYWTFYISNINLSIGPYQVSIEESNTKRIIYQNILQV